MRRSLHIPLLALLHLTAADQAHHESQRLLDEHDIDGLQLLQRSTLKHSGVKSFDPQHYEEELAAVLGEKIHKHPGHRREPPAVSEDALLAAVLGEKMNKHPGHRREPPAVSEDALRAKADVRLAKHERHDDVRGSGPDGADVQHDSGKDHGGDGAEHQQHHRAQLEKDASESNEAEAAAAKMEVKADVQLAVHEYHDSDRGRSLDDALSNQGVRNPTMLTHYPKEHVKDTESEQRRQVHMGKDVEESDKADTVALETQLKVEGAMDSAMWHLEPPGPFHAFFGHVSQAMNSAMRHLEGAGVQNPSPTLVAYPLTVLFVTLMIVVIYWPQGGSVIARILVYLFALSTMKLAVKFVFEEYSFHYPKFITSLHMAASALAGFSVLLYRRLAQSREIAVPTLHEFFLKVVPVSLGFALSLASNNMALVFCSASFAEIAGSTSPIFSVGMMSLLGLPFDKRLLLPTCVVVAGCMLSVSGELDFSALGFGLVLLANLARAFKVTLQAELMTGATKEKFDPCTLLAWMCSASCALMLGWCAATEGVGPIQKFYHHERWQGLAIAIGISCANACILNAAMLFVTKELGAVGSQLVAQIKAVLTVLGSMALFGDSVSRSECVGFVAVLAGAFAYSRMEKWLKEEKSKKARELNLTRVK